MKNSIKPNGFSLIEIMIALLILAFALLALAGLMVTTIQNNSFGGHMTEAASLCQGKLEELRARPWCDLGFFSGNDVREGSTKVAYNLAWNVDDPAIPTICDTLRTIAITVTWTDKVGHSIRFRSVLSHDVCPTCPQR